MEEGEVSLDQRLAAIASPQRLRIIAELLRHPTHVSELARQMAMSRPLLYMHLNKLEAAGFVTGRLELSSDGRALKYFEVVDFELLLTPTVLADAAPEPEGSDP